MRRAMGGGGGGGTVADYLSVRAIFPPEFFCGVALRAVLRPRLEPAGCPMWSRFLRLTRNGTRFLTVSLTGSLP